MTQIDVAQIKLDFPILGRTVRDGQKLVYLDSGATSQKPLVVLDAERDFYLQHNAAVHRGAHQLAEEATDAYEAARLNIAKFIHARPDDIIFTKNATEAINIVSYAFANATMKSRAGIVLDDDTQRFVLKDGDEIVVTEMEHHANLVPWQELCDKVGATLRWIGLTDEGRLNYDDLATVINSRTKLVALTHQSNLLGTVNDVSAVVAAAHVVGALVLLDSCQSVPHMPVNVGDLGVDFMAWSGHKMLGPMGIGCLWGKTALLNAMPPFITGGSMIETVHMEHSTFSQAPRRFEAGVPMAAQAVGLSAAVDYLNTVGMQNIADHEHHLTELALAELSGIPGVRIIGPLDSQLRGSALSFVVDEIHPHDVGQILDEHGIAVRVGHHCAWPVCRRYSVPATTRATFYLYNDESDVIALRDGILAAQKFFGVGS